MEVFQDYFNKVLGFAVSLLMASVVLTVLWQIASRYLLDDPSAVSEEIARFLLIWLGILGAVYAYSKDAHLSLDLFVNKLNTVNKQRVQLFVHLLILLFALTVMVYGGFKLVNVTLEPVQISSILGIKIANVYAMLPFAGVLFALLSIIKITQNWSKM